MSDLDELSSRPDIPADAEIEQCLRAVVRDAVKKDEVVTVKLARTRAEEKLGLDAGFLKNNAQWKQKSSDLISAAFEEPSSPEVPKKTAKATQTKPNAKAGTKRKSDETQPSRKKRKKSTVSNSEDDGSTFGEVSDHSEDDVPKKASTKPEPENVPKSEDESALSEPPDEGEQSKTKGQNGKDTHVDDESDLSSVIDEPAPKKKRQKKAASAPKAKPKPAKAKPAAISRPPAEDDESDLSSVLDDPPPPKKGRKKKSTSPAATSKTKSKPLSPDDEEIKRLQSWLLKCGVRKLWHRELAPFDSNKKKIRHLKGMLEEVGMTGRYSAEKARQIKEARELKAELEAATEFNRTWGHEKDGEGSGGEESGKDGEGKEEEEKSAPGKRARPKGFVDFGDSDEESE